MEWFYAVNGQQQGPITEAQLMELRRSGAINSETLVWREGMSDWQPVSAALPAIAPPPIAAGATAGQPGPALSLCSECRRVFAQSDMILLNGCWVCAECKPLFLQRLREGGAPTFSVGNIWRFKNQMVLRSETPMPDRCVRCNEPANGFRLKRTLWWHPPALYILVVVSLIIYLIVAVIVRKKAVLFVPLCTRHRQLRSRNIMTAWGLVVGSIASFIAAAAFSVAWPAVFGVVMLLAALVMGVLGTTRIVYASKIDKEFAWVKGAGPAFLANLPERSGF